MLSHSWTAGFAFLERPGASLTKRSPFALDFAARGRSVQMKSQTRVVVIGGGIAGCSTLYHLTQEGWTDVVLVERNELTSGTTWHSAAQVTNFGMTQTMVGLKSHSIKLYKDLAATSRARPRSWGWSSKSSMLPNARGGIR
jgi:2-polyprenyl-6-methoxyphenol hydroxylase-like FAD-dependent oxidoreductase